MIKNPTYATFMNEVESYISDLLGDDLNKSFQILRETT